MDLTFILQAIIVILLIIFLYYCIYRHSGFNTVNIHSSVDGESYKVHDMHPDYKEAADILAIINKNNIKLFRYLKNKYIDEANPIDPQMKDNLKFMLNNYNPENIQETSPRNIEGQTSYVTDKGDVISYCLRSKKNLKILDESILMFVNLHEITHIFSYKEDQHTNQFWKNFKWILTQAKDAGIYDPIDYAKTPTRYCGMEVDYNPYFDTGL